jgi:hypothetical protein
LREYHIIELNSVRDIDHVRSNPPNDAIRYAMHGVRFRRIIDNFPLPDTTNLFISDNSYNRNLLEEYQSISVSAHTDATCGEFVFDSVFTHGHDSLVIDHASRAVFIGHLINWSREYFDWWLENSDIGFVKWTSETSFLADFGQPVPGTHGAILMNSPGYGIFGHWLIDFVPRMALSRLMTGSDTALHLFGPMADWMRDLVARAGIRQFQPAGTGLAMHRKLRVPSATKSGHGFAEPITALAWRTLALGYNRQNVERDLQTGDRLFVSRKHWQDTRAIDFHDELESLMVQRGFSILHPEKLSLSEQAGMFAKAKVIVGEDGSALHNIIFSTPGTRLGVLMDPQRSNLWHAGICHLLGHRLAYAQLPRVLSEMAGDLSAVGNFIDQICAG